jgi:hypothetical protein
MKMVKPHLPVLLVMLAVAAVFWLLPQAVRAGAPAQIPFCDGARVLIEGGQPSPFILPDFAGGKLRVDPSAVLEIRAENIPPGARLNWRLRGFGTKLADKDLDIGSGVARVRIEDISTHARGIFEIDGTIFSGFGELCSVPFELDISGFGGTTAMAATGLSAAAGLGALASVPLSANGLNAKVNLKVQIRRRRPRGLRRWLPVPNWKRTMLSTITGAITGLGIAVLLQQGGFAPLSLANALKGAIGGGAATFGVGYSLGVLLTFIKPPIPPPDEEA